MTAGIERHLALLEVIKTANPELRRSIIKHSDPEVIDAITEVCYNYLRGNIECSKTQFKQLSKHKNCLRKIVKCGDKNCRSKTNQARGKERAILMQKGNGFWLPLLIPVISELSSLIFSRVLK